ncbi:hypothetical protein RF11_16504 [Thelohanellus kitauei]|uniref:Uncharacterized protein n=1 Tax=Thelohanellus kitauei TaxID=669202 RepID=A0A0C2N2V0_THEKT|nr:hypothetical protein RF11_16504 [Thelohanellus kitauei]
MTAKMAKNMFYRMSLHQESPENFLVTHGLVVNAATIHQNRFNLLYFKRTRKLTNQTRDKLGQYGQKIEELPTLRFRSCDTPIVVVQIDECLLRAQRLYIRGRLLQGDENIIQEDRDEWLRMNNNQPMNPNRNYGMRISGPWIFGLMECIKDNQGKYKSGEVRLFKVEGRDSNTLLPLIKSHVHTGSMIWSDQCAAYNSQSRDL